MSCVGVNDENSGVISREKDSGSCQDLFSLDQPTGRPSILRQTENLPSKSVPRSAKVQVCFQTPRRDPVTRRILSPSKSVSLSGVDENTNPMISPNEEKPDVLTHDPIEPPKPEPSTFPDDNMPIHSGGGYLLDFDNLDAIDPFRGSTKMADSPARPVVTEPAAEDLLQEQLADAALSDTLPFMSSVENSLADISSTESSVVTVNLPALPAEEELEDGSATPADVSASIGHQEASGSFTEEQPPPAKGAYALDYDNLDAINPFQAGGSKIPNSPVGRTSDIDPPAEEETPADVAESPEEEKTPPTAASEPSDGSLPEGPIKLEFNFSNGREVELKPPPKRLGKKPTDVKYKGTETKNKDPKPSEGAAGKTAPSDDVPTSRASYSLDLETFDDPYFNPFGTKTNVSNSPKSSSGPGPVALETAPGEQTTEPEEAAASSESAAETLPPAQPHQASSGSRDGVVLPKNRLEDGCGREGLQVQNPFEPQPQTGSHDGDEEFVPGATFIASDFDGQIDYLEQFGSSSFKESALRKQSLYLKFDPLLRESPKKSAGPAALLLSAAPSGLASRLNGADAESAAPQSGVLRLDSAASPPVLQSLIAADGGEPIIEVLKYSQKDMEAALARLQAEKEEEWGGRYRELQSDGQELRKVISEYELMIAKMNATQEKEREEAQRKLSQALQEKEQVSGDLGAMERSFGELFKRLEKYKEVVEGYKKNEETLKACAQDYLGRIKKAEQRYQALKAHAEEKINLANQEIAEVRSKNKAELSVLQAQQRRERLKMESLERNLEQKEKEVEELTKLCDELISKVQKG